MTVREAEPRRLTADPIPDDRRPLGGMRPGYIVALMALVVAATALRMYKLGQWGFADDEIFTLRDSIDVKFTNPRPLLYLLNHYLVQPLLPLDELGLRLLPALFGVLAVPALYFAGRRLVGARAALFAALLLTFNTYHVYQSQFARYWSLVFLLSAVYPFALYLGVRDRRRGMLALGFLTALLATLAHPVSVLLFGGVALFLATRVRREHLKLLWSRKPVRWAALVAIVLAGAVALRYVSILQGWITSHDAPPGQRGDHLLHLPGGLGVKQAAYLLSFVEGLTIPLALIAALGILVLWQGRDRTLAIFLTCLFVFPVGFFVLLSLRTAVSTTYLIPVTPVVFLAAGVLLDRVAGIDWGPRPRWLLAAGLTALILHSGAPTLFSNYRDGRRHDFRGVARWLGERLAPADVLVSDQPRVIAHYLPQTEIQPLRGDPALLQESLQQLRASGHPGVLWIVAPYSSPGGVRTNPRIRHLKEWIYGNCQLRNTVGMARLDFRHNELQIYRCPAGTPSERGATSE